MISSCSVLLSVRILREVALEFWSFRSFGAAGFEASELEKTRRKQLSKAELEKTRRMLASGFILDVSRPQNPCSCVVRSSIFKKSVFSTLSSKKDSRSVLRAPQNAPEGSLGAPGASPGLPRSSPRHPQKLQRQPTGVQDVSTGPPAGVAAPF